MTGFDLGLLTLKAVPYGASDVPARGGRVLTCPYGAGKRTGILTYFQRKVNKK